MSGSKVPEWDLSPMYPGFDSPKYVGTKKTLSAKTAELQAHLALDPGKEYAAWLKRALALISETGSTGETLCSYAYAVYTTDTRDARATSELNQVEELGLPLRRASTSPSATRWRPGRRSPKPCSPPTRPRADSLCTLPRKSSRSRRQMPPDLEDLAADLSRSGADAWSRLQESLSSNASCVWDEATGERKTVVELRNLAYRRRPGRAREGLPQGTRVLEGRGDPHGRRPERRQGRQRRPGRAPRLEKRPRTIRLPGPDRAQDPGRPDRAPWRTPCPSSAAT